MLTEVTLVQDLLPILSLLISAMKIIGFVSIGETMRTTPYVRIELSRERFTLSIERKYRKHAINASSLRSKKNR